MGLGITRVSVGPHRKQGARAFRDIAGTTRGYASRCNDRVRVESGLRHVVAHVSQSSLFHIMLLPLPFRIELAGFRCTLKPSDTSAQTMVGLASLN